MKYSELIQFDPIETVVQLNQADKGDQALRLVQTFVISDRMGEQLSSVVFQQLQFQTPADNKGLLVVGNYGTGKSHQLAVISAVAENAELASQLTNPAVAHAAEQIAGQFVVIRAEINSSMPLRQFVLETFQEALAGHGVYFEIPPEEQVRNHKDVFASMMAEFTKVFPDKGLLFVLDELLVSGDSENWSRCDTKSGPPLRATDQAQRHDRGPVTSGAELPGCGIGNTRGCPDDPWPHRSWVGPQADRQGTGLLA